MLELIRTCKTVQFDHGQRNAYFQVAGHLLRHINMLNYVKIFIWKENTASGIANYHRGCSRYGKYWLLQIIQKDLKQFYCNLKLTIKIIFQK